MARSISAGIGSAWSSETSGDDELPRDRERELAATQADGLPNYFDDQRFGSVGFSGEFIGHAWLLGDHERALAPGPGGTQSVRPCRSQGSEGDLREFWGRWPRQRTGSERSSTRSIVTYLVDHPTDFRGAFARLPREHPDALFLGLPEPPLEPDPGRLARALDADRSTRGDRAQDRDVPVSSRARAGASPNARRTADSAAFVPEPAAPRVPGRGAFEMCSSAFELTWPSTASQALERCVLFQRDSTRPRISRKTGVERLR